MLNKFMEDHSLQNSNDFYPTALKEGPVSLIIGPEPRRWWAEHRYTLSDEYEFYIYMCETYFPHLPIETQLRRKLITLQAEPDIIRAITPSLIRVEGEIINLHTLLEEILKKDNSDAAVEQNLGHLLDLGGRKAALESAKVGWGIPQPASPRSPSNSIPRGAPRKGRFFKPGETSGESKSNRDEPIFMPRPPSPKVPRPSSPKARRKHRQGAHYEKYTDKLSRARKRRRGKNPSLVLPLDPQFAPDQGTLSTLLETVATLSPLVPYIKHLVPPNPPRDDEIALPDQGALSTPLVPAVETLPPICLQNKYQITPVKNESL